MLYPIILDGMKSFINRVKQSFESTEEKKSLVKSYVTGICDKQHGESFACIIRYFIPEFITAIVLYSMIYFYDAWLIAHLRSTPIYATVGVTNTLIHLITKMAEGFSVATIVVAGRYNGRGDFKCVGRTLVDAFWVTALTGGVVAAFLYIGAPWIYAWYGVPEQLIELGTPYLKTRALSILFMYIFFAFIGFLRGIKNTYVPMVIFILGGVIFCFFDYVLIFGAMGFPVMKLQGSAMASVLQYASMMIFSMTYVLCKKEYRKYSFSLFKDLGKWENIRHLLHISWPVVLDKSILALAYLWLGAMLSPLGVNIIASYSVIKDLERFAIMPAAALAQVITFLVSNSYDVKDWKGIKANIKKIIFLASFFVFFILLVFSIWPEFFISIFDKRGDFTAFSAKVFPLLSILVFFDLLQLILAGALRGAADVKTVMFTRLVVVLFFFVPISSLFAYMTIENIVLKFFLIYGSFYIGSALMSIVYIYRFRGERWKVKSV